MGHCDNSYWFIADCSNVDSTDCISLKLLCCLTDINSILISLIEKDIKDNKIKANQKRLLTPEKMSDIFICAFTS